MIINVIHISSFRMLKGDGFDYFQSYRSPAKGKSSTTMKKSSDDWFSARRKLYSDKSPKMKQLSDSNLSGDKCNNLNNVKFYVSNQFFY